MDTKNVIATLSQSLLDEVKKIMKKEKSEKSEKGESEADEKREHCSEALKGDQHKIDANKNGKVDAHDFHLLRKKKKGVAETYNDLNSGEEIEEDVEVLDENVAKVINTADQMVKSGKAKEMHGAISSAIDKHFPMYSKVTKKKVHAQALDRVKKMNEDLEEAVKEPYAVGMAAAMKSTGDKPPLKKSTIMKAHKIAKKIKEETEEVSEDAEQIDELSTKTLDSYRSKARKDIIDADANDDTDTYNKRTKGYTKASKKIQKNFVKGVDESFEQLDEISAELAARAGDKADERVRVLANKRKWGVNASPLENKLRKQTRKFDNYADKKQGYTTEDTKVELTQEEIDRLDAMMADLEEGRGRPPKEGSEAWKKRQEAGAAEQDEPRQHPIQQLERIKRDMRGGAEFKHKDGSTHHLTGGQAAKLLDKYHGMKPAEKEAMQKEIHGSHAGLKKHL